MDELKIVQRKISELKHAEYNPRKISEHDFEHLKKSLSEFKAVEPAIINMNSKRKNIIIGGNQRIDAAKSLGWETFPCIELKLSKTKEKELNIRLNRNAGTWDFDLLDQFFNDKEELLSFGFTNFEINGIGLNESNHNEKDIDFDNINVEELEKKIIKCPSCNHEWYDDKK